MVDQAELQQQAADRDAAALRAAQAEALAAQQAKDQQAWNDNIAAGKAATEKAQALAAAQSPTIPTSQLIPTSTVTAILNKPGSSITAEDTQIVSKYQMQTAEQNARADAAAQASSNLAGSTVNSQGQRIYQSYQQDPDYGRMESYLMKPTEYVYNRPEIMADLAQFVSKYPEYANIYQLASSQNPMSSSEIAAALAQPAITGLSYAIPDAVVAANVAAGIPTVQTGGSQTVGGIPVSIPTPLVPKVDLTNPFNLPTYDLTVPKDYVPFSAPVATKVSEVIDNIPSLANINLPGPMGLTVTALYGKGNEPLLNLPGPEGLTVVGIQGITKPSDIYAPPGGTVSYAPQSSGNLLDVAGFGLLASGIAMSKNTEDFFKSVQDFVPSGVVGSPIKAGFGFVESIPQVVSMVPLVAGAAYVFGKDIKYGATQIIPTATEIGSGMITRAVEQPERTFGNLLGAAYTGEMAETAVGAGKYLSPIGIDIAEIPATSGARSSVLFAYTKPFASGMEEATVKVFAAFDAASEPAKVVASKSFALNPTDIKFINEAVPSFPSVSAAKESFNALAGKEGSFIHASSDVKFVQQLMERGEVTVQAGTKGTEPLYVSGIKDTTFSQFLRGASEFQPGSSAIVRITATPKTVEEALAFKGTAISPELEPGLYPGTKPITGVTFRGSLQQEMIIPAGSKLSVTDVGFIEKSGVKIPVIDVTIGSASVVERVGNAVNKLEYDINAIKAPEVGLGQPTGFLKRSSIEMTNPLEEVASKQWSGQQRAVLDPYLKQMAKEPSANVGLKAVVAGKEALPLFREVSFVQREPVGQVLVGREMSAETIGKVFANREAMGSDVMSGGSTTIRANLGTSFIDKSLIGDIDAWAKANKVAELQASEIKIIAKDQPSVITSRSPGLQKGFPVAEVRIAGSEKPLTEIHSFEAFPAVKQPSNIGTLTAVGGAKVTGPTTGFFGGLRKSSAAFDEMRLVQTPGGQPKIELNVASAKHAVGASAVAKESASLFYGRDIGITGMEQSYKKGMILERYANTMDELLASQKGEAAKTIQKYQGTIKTNPLELPETQKAKFEALTKETKEPTKMYSGVPKPELKEYPISYYEMEEYKSTGESALVGTSVMASIGVANAPSYPDVITNEKQIETVSGIYNPSPIEKSLQQLTPSTIYPSTTVTSKIDRAVGISGYPEIPTLPETIVTKQPTVIIPTYPIITPTYPVITPEYPTFPTIPPTTIPPTTTHGKTPDVFRTWDRIVKFPDETKTPFEAAGIKEFPFVVLNQKEEKGKRRKSIPSFARKAELFTYESSPETARAILFVNKPQALKKTKAFKLPKVRRL
jgi:hypothetical protein